MQAPTESDIKLAEMIEQSRAMMEMSYCPYSHFRVGSVVETADGHTYTGCNVENANLSMSICAERTAMCKAISERHRKFTRIVISSDLDDYIAPCGACRQFMTEFGVEWEVYATKPDKTYIMRTVSQLHPLHFILPETS